ncbi:MAG: methyl-accepting chemotaxis protein [Microthrixaceae bacterium]
MPTTRTSSRTASTTPRRRAATDGRATPKRPAAPTRAAAKPKRAAAPKRTAAAPKRTAGVQRWQRAFDAAPLAQLVLDPTGVVVAANPATMALLGRLHEAGQERSRDPFAAAADQHHVVGAGLSSLGLGDEVLDLATAARRGLVPAAAVATMGSCSIETTCVRLGAADAATGGAADEELLVTLRDVTDATTLALTAARMKAMVDNAPTNIMFADRDLALQYMNPRSLATLRDLDQYLPVRADDMDGTIIDVFHQHPEHQRRMLSDPSHLPHRAVIGVGPEKLELIVSACMGDDGTYLGAMASWDVVTERLQILEAIEAAAAGDLTHEISLEGDSTFGQMAEGLRQLLSSLRDSIGQIASNAQTLAAASEQLMRVSNEMGSSADQTSTQANAASAASEQVSTSVSTVASATEEMGATISEIARNASTGAEVAARAVDAALTTNTTISKLGESSTEIGQIVKVITSIAQQTNLLALNATIEAARAGEAGKGFAVVANEVKELAKATAKATEDISGRIETIQTDTADAVEAIDGISTVINEISDIQNTIASAVEEQAATTAEIGRSVTEAARGSAEIADNIVQVAEGAGATSSGVSDTQRAATELARMATVLQQLVERFSV